MRPQNSRQKIKLGSLNGTWVIQNVETVPTKHILNAMTVPSSGDFECRDFLDLLKVLKVKN
jgi:hypothetical protein